MSAIGNNRSNTRELKLNISQQPENITLLNGKLSPIVELTQLKLKNYSDKIETGSSSKRNIFSSSTSSLSEDVEIEETGDQIDSYDLPDKSFRCFSVASLVTKESTLKGKEKQQLPQSQLKEFTSTSFPKNSNQIQTQTSSSSSSIQIQSPPKLEGEIISSLYHLSTRSCFVFPRIKILTTGSFKLKFDLYEILMDGIHLVSSIYSNVFSVFEKSIAVVPDLNYTFPSDPFKNQVFSGVKLSPSEIKREENFPLSNQNSLNRSHSTSSFYSRKHKIPSSSLAFKPLTRSNTNTKRFNIDDDDNGIDFNPYPMMDQDLPPPLLPLPSPLPSTLNYSGQSNSYYIPPRSNPNELPHLPAANLFPTTQQFFPSPPPLPFDFSTNSKSTQYSPNRHQSLPSPTHHYPLISTRSFSIPSHFPSQTQSQDYNNITPLPLPLESIPKRPKFIRRIEDRGIRKWKEVEIENENEEQNKRSRIMESNLRESFNTERENERNEDKEKNKFSKDTVRRGINVNISAGKGDLKFLLSEEDEYIEKGMIANDFFCE